jgi:hypothetical protein
MKLATARIALDAVYDEKELQNIKERFLIAYKDQLASGKTAFDINFIMGYPLTCQHFNALEVAMKKWLSKMTDLEPDPTWREVRVRITQSTVTNGIIQKIHVVKPENKK